MAQTITFNKEGDAYVAYFEAKTDFALHIEHADPQPMIMEQSTTGGGYAIVEDFPTKAFKALDYEVPVLVGPKFIKVVCLTEPTYAAVTSSGEIKELLYQEKSIEVKDNGTTVVTPDAGFMALSKVEVKTNVPKGEGGSGGANYEYVDIRGLVGEEKFNIVLIATTAKMKYEGRTLIFSPATLYAIGIMSETDVIDYVMIDWNVSVTNFDFTDTVMTGKEFIKAAYPNLDIDSLPRITEEEYYNLNA